MNTKAAPIKTAVMENSRFAPYIERNQTLPVVESVNRRTFTHALTAVSPFSVNDWVCATGGGSPMLLFNLFGVNSGAADCYVQIFDLREAPADGEAPRLCLRSYAGDNFSFGLREVPWRFNRGIYVCASSTFATKTILTSGVFCFAGEYLHEGVPA